MNAGDFELAAGLFEIAGNIEADEIRRMSRAELELLEPELWLGCCCDAETEVA